MKEELQSKLVEILTSIQTAAGKASDFAMEQLPTVAQEYVAFGRAWETLWLVGVLLIALTITFFLVRGCKRQSIDGEGAFFGLLFTGASWVMTVASAKPFLLVWFAPKVWLLKEIASLLK